MRKEYQNDLQLRKQYSSNSVHIKKITFQNAEENQKNTEKYYNENEKCIEDAQILSDILKFFPDSDDEEGPSDSITDSDLISYLNEPIYVSDKEDHTTFDQTLLADMSPNELELLTNLEENLIDYVFDLRDDFQNDSQEQTIINEVDQLASETKYDNWPAVTSPGHIQQSLENNTDSLTANLENGHSIAANHLSLWVTYPLQGILITNSELSQPVSVLRFLS